MGRVKGVANGERPVAKTSMGKMVGLYMFFWGHGIHGQQEISLEKGGRV